MDQKKKMLQVNYIHVYIYWNIKWWIKTEIAGSYRRSNNDWYQTAQAQAAIQYFSTQALES